MNHWLRAATICRNTREHLIELLNACLADCLAVKLASKQAHWNVKGPSFVGLHELFDNIAKDVEGYADLIAERAVQLGGTAEGTVQIVSKRSRLEPSAISDWEAHVPAMADILATFGRQVRSAIDRSSQLHDMGSADIFTEVSRGIDKWLWFVEAHMQSDGRTYVEPLVETDTVQG